MRSWRGWGRGEGRWAARTTAAANRRIVRKRVAIVARKVEPCPQMREIAMRVAILLLATACWIGIPSPVIAGNERPLTPPVERPNMTPIPGAYAYACCKRCVQGCACGNTCISCAKTCRVGPGCACGKDGGVDLLKWRG